MMDNDFLVLLWIMMALVSGWIAAEKRGPFVGLLHFLFGLALWPIALVSAILAKPRAVKADGFIAGKPYWGNESKGYVARIDGRDIRFASLAEMQTALGAAPIPLAPTPLDEPPPIGARLWRKITQL